MTPEARTYLDASENTYALRVRIDLAANIACELVRYYGTSENPETLACYAVNQADWLLSVLAR